MTLPKSPIAWVLIFVGGATALCCTGTLGLMALGLFAEDDTAASASLAPMPGAAGRTGQPGAPGGFAFDAPKGWRVIGEGRHLIEEKDRQDILGVEVVRLPSVPGLEDGEGKVARLWHERIGADWNGVTSTPPVLRRFVSNGARAFFTASPLRSKKDGALFRLSLYLVEADDRFEPLVFIQSYVPENPIARDMSAGLSWDTSHRNVELALAGVRGSPVGAPLVDDTEVVGNFAYGTGSSLQWVNTFTGATSMTAVSYNIKYAFSGDHTFVYAYAGASGQVGAMQFGKENDEGEWSVKHDVLTVAGQVRTRKYLLIGAARTPEGRRTLYLMPEHPAWSLYPGAIAQHAELYVEKN
jgi:hypothetical protein